MWYNQGRVFLLKYNKIKFDRLSSLVICKVYILMWNHTSYYIFDFDVIVAHKMNLPFGCRQLKTINWNIDTLKCRYLLFFPTILCFHFVVRSDNVCSLHSLIVHNRIKDLFRLFFFRIFIWYEIFARMLEHWPLQNYQTFDANCLFRCHRINNYCH